MKHSLDLTLYLIVKNEEIHLDRCLNSFAGIWKELLIVDTGSTDTTKEIAANHGARVLDFEWIDDFSAARNFALDNVKTEWVMMVDADDIIHPEDKEELIKALDSSVPKFDVTMMKYIYFGTKQRPKMVHYFPRIWRTDKGYRYHRPIHETLNHVEKKADTQFSEIPIVHSKLITHERSIDRNMRMLRAHLEKEPDDWLSIMYIGHEYQDQGDMVKANEYYQKVIDAKPSDINRIYEAYTRRGSNHLRLGKVVEARKDYENAIATGCAFIEPYLHLAEIEMNIYSPDRAIELLNYARKLKPPKVPFSYDISHYFGIADKLLEVAIRLKATRNHA